MARTTTEHSIVVKSANKLGPVFREAIADEVMYPGHLVRFDADEELELHATADGALPGKLVVVENPVPDTHTYPTTAAIDIPYAANDLAYYVEGQPGDVLNMKLATGQTATMGIAPLVSNGDGTLKTATVGAGTLANAIVGYADEDVTTGTATARIRVRII
jgi:hypothetical protein